MGGNTEAREPLIVFDKAETGRKLEAALLENERLRSRLGAVRHSLGNHLALMSAMLSRQARGCDQAEAKTALVAAQNRISAIAEALRASMIDPDLDVVDVGEPIARLVDEFRAHAADLDIDVSCEVEASTIRADDAVSLLLVLNELASNALAHAFPDHTRGAVRILFYTDAGSLNLVVEDDGVGKGAEAPSRLGDKIILGAVRNLGATLTETASKNDPGRPGLRVVVSKPLAVG